MGLCASVDIGSDQGMKKMSSKQSASLEKRDKGEFVVHLLAASNVPNMDVGSLSDCYCLLQIVKTKGSKPKEKPIPLSAVYRSTVRRDTLHPTWNSFAVFPIIPDEKDYLWVRLLDHDDFSRDDAIGETFIPIKNLRTRAIKSHEFAFARQASSKFSGGASSEQIIPTVSSEEKLQILRKKTESFQNGFTYPLEMLTSQPAPDKSKPTVVKLVALSEEETQKACTKDFFLIRHGESKWNKAQKDKNIGAMLAYDHPLDAAGVTQARALRQLWMNKKTAGELSDLEQKFLHVDRVIASPLTRALQTAMLACSGLVALEKSKAELTSGSPPSLVLLRNLREKKNTRGSLDTIGKAVGGDIKTRALEELEKVCGEDAASVVQRLSAIAIDVNDCESAWWTEAGSDSKRSLKSRFEELWATLRWFDINSAVLVGHSLFFREMMRLFIGKGFATRQPELVADLKTHKMNNAAVLHVRVTFPTDFAAHMRPEITSAKLLFGSTLHYSSSDHDHVTDKEHKISKAAAAKNDDDG